MSKVKNVVIFDLDGTLMDTTHREELREAGLWEAYYNACDKDTPKKEVIELMNKYHDAGYHVWILSGRGQESEEKTLKSLEDAGAKYDNIRMRGIGIKIPDYNLKPSWVVKYIGAENVAAAFDDREKVIENLKKKGVENVYDITKGIPTDLVIGKIDAPKVVLVPPPVEPKEEKKPSVKTKMRP